MTTKTPSSIVLVHGAWHGAWCWKRVLPLLRGTGVKPMPSRSPAWASGRTC
ncbi:hypothetical protein Y695_01789 [Hydrogenophaga sp. T4]|nr:hypothetical protein Y695_01789 [Hydrogenophaga sp. T4]